MKMLMRDWFWAAFIVVGLGMPLAFVHIGEPAKAQNMQGRSDPLVNGGQGAINCPASSGVILLANPDRFRLQIFNVSSSATIWITTTTVQGTCNGQAALNTSCSIPIAPLGAYVLDQTRWTSAIACISSAGPSQITTLEW